MIKVLGSVISPTINGRYSRCAGLCGFKSFRRRSVSFFSISYSSIDCFLSKSFVDIRSRVLLVINYSSVLSLLDSPYLSNRQPWYPENQTYRSYSSQQRDHHNNGVTSSKEWNRQCKMILLKYPTTTLSSIETTQQQQQQQPLSQEDLNIALTLLHQLEMLRRQGEAGNDDETPDAEFLSNQHLEKDHDTKKSDDNEETLVDANLAWTLLEKVILVSSSSQSDTISKSFPTTNILRSILRLWRLQWKNVIEEGKQQHHNDLPTPQVVLTKINEWRTNPDVGLRIGLLDVYCCNVILGVAGRLGQYDTFCKPIYQWMWEESIIDSSIRPDLITLRTMIRAILTDTTTKGDGVTPIQVAEECEVLVQDYLSKSKTNREDNITAIYQSILPIWARTDPIQARQYLKLMMKLHLQYRTDVEMAHKCPPPRALDWNKVISAAAIQHGNPELGAQILHDFEVFTSQLRDSLTSELDISAQQSLILNNDYTKAIKESRLQKIPQPDIFTWNSLLEGWGRIGNSEQANHIYDSIISGTNGGSVSVKPNIVTFTSAMKANRSNWDRVNHIAESCLVYSQQQIEEQQHDIVADAAFFHGWLQACIDRVKSEGHSSYGDRTAAPTQAMTVAETILTETMPSFGLKPSKLSFKYLLDCFIIQDDLEGATQWLMKHLRMMDEATIVEWTLALSNMGDIELVSFLDKVTRRTPKTLLQVLIENGHLESSNVLEHLLRSLLVEKGLQALEWLHPDQRTLKCFAIVIRKISSSSRVSIDDAKRFEDLWEFAKRQSTNRMMIDQATTMMDRMHTISEIYTSLIVAWSKTPDMAKVQKWWSMWMQDRQMMEYAPPTSTAQTAVLSCLAASFQPNQAQTFLGEIYDMYQNGQLQEPPDTVMLNLVLNAWMMSANGRAATEAMLKGKDKYGINPDVISYNTIVQAYVKGRRLDHASTFVRDHIGVVMNFPDVVTFRSILLGWSLHRQDYELALREVTKVSQWMSQLHSNGILKVDHQTDPGIQNIMADLEQRVHRQRKKNKKVTTTA